MYSRTILLFITSVSVLLFTSCAPTHPLIGKWQASDSAVTFEFFKEGTVSTKAGGSFFTGSFSFVDTDRIKMEFGGVVALAGPRIVKISVSGDEMSMTEADGKANRFKRTK